ncbi:hypothetical protein [Burkholderia ambifaria]|uniref:hypothetical protein n=1 Tax=Burkholderia ambifaria TaxID=152480 RepID=UPI0015887C15|nr:hypothetical protein [Burkholderia ambifaria]
MKQTYLAHLAAQPQKLCQITIKKRKEGTMKKMGSLLYSPFRAQMQGMAGILLGQFINELSLNPFSRTRGSLRDMSRTEPVEATDLLASRSADFDHTTGPCSSSMWPFLLRAMPRIRYRALTDIGFEPALYFNALV